MDKPELHLPLEEQAQWAQEAGTQALLKYLREMVRYSQEEWSDRRYEDQNSHAWLTKNTAALAAVDVLNQMIYMIDDMANKEPTDEVQQ